MPRNYYDLLGVHPDAPQTEIYDAYVAALQEFRASADANLEVAKQRLAAVRIAYDALKTPPSRRAYNARMGLGPPPERRWEPDPLVELLEGPWRMKRSKYYWRGRGIGLIALLAAFAFTIVRYLLE